VVGGDGAIYAIRRHLYWPLDASDINDFVNPLQIVAAGYRGIFDPEAVCSENSAGDFEKEFGRKVRIVNRSFNGLLRVPQVLNPWRHGRFAWLLLSHKLLRWFSPALLLAHLLLTLALPTSWLGTITLLGYLLFALAALIGWTADQRKRRVPGPFSLAYYFLLMNVACAIGVARRLRGERIVTWSPMRHSATAQSSGSLNAFALASVVALLTLLRLYAHAGGSFSKLLDLLIVLLSLLLLYAYAGYPLLLGLLRSRLRRPHVVDEALRPSVTLLIAAFNEEAVLRQKLENSLALDYPRERLRILVASDGSTDATEAIAREFSRSRVELLALSPNRGKVTALNKAMQGIDSGIVLLSDANVMYLPDAVRKLVRHFADPAVGAVSGKVMLVNDQLSYSAAEDQYYSVEHFIQQAEGETGSMIGSDGAMYAIRRELYSFPPADTILDDFVISMGVIRQGRRLLHDSEAVGYERNEQELKQEFRRKVRIIAGGIQCLLRGDGWPPATDRLNCLKFISHKVLRWLSGPMLALLVVSLLLVLWAQPLPPLPVRLIAYGLAAGGLLELAILLSPGLRRCKLPALVHYVLVMNLASLVGCWRGLTGRQRVTWKQPEPAAVAEGGG
jgi:cellulose synthase/poly-beta-1,6-N-acetylglucosamine synthase-like glycosyltransferase